ncbi:MAG: hypothetical protein R3C03_20105 [Pirellulaceae bacterium]
MTVYVRNKAFFVFAICWFIACINANAELIVDYRYSQGGFDVSAGVGSSSDRHRVTPPGFEDLSGAFSMNEVYTASASSTVPPVTGTASAFGQYLRFDDLSWNSSSISIVANETSSGWATSADGGLSFSDVTGYYEVDFTVVGTPAMFHIVGDFSPANLGVSEVKIEGPFFGQNQFLANTQQTFDTTGILQPGAYRFLVQNGSSAFSFGGASDPPFSGGHSIALNISSVPEPGAMVLISLAVLTCQASRRKRKPVSI